MVYDGTSVAKDFLDVRYENLIAEPDQTIRQICKFLDEEFEPGMLDFGSRLYLVPQRELHIHTKLAKPILKNVGLWRSKLSPMECFLMEAPLHRDLTNSSTRFASMVGSGNPCSM